MIAIDLYEVIPHCDFDLHFSSNLAAAAAAAVATVISIVEHLFLWLLASYMSSLEKCLFRPSARFFDWVVCVFDTEL